MTDTGDTLAPGTRLGELEIERVLGAGGFGVTYLARDLSLDAWRAVKEYLPRDWGTRQRDGTIGPRTGADAEDYEWGLTRFLEEARILARFDHPNLVRVYRVFEAAGTAYMVTEYVEGETLAAGLKESGPWAEPQVRELLDALTEGLSAVHGAGLLHRDIKPGNVMVRPDGTAVLIDFGAARQAMGRQSRSVTAVLTPGYAPIEQYSGRGNQGPWTDIYSLGALAYEALSRQTPEDATERVIEDRLRPTGDAAPQRVTSGLAAAIDTALAVDGRDRPQSLDAWRALLDGPGGVAPVSARPRGGKSAGSAAATGTVGGDVVAGRSGRAAAGALAWRRWWLPGAAVAGLVVVALLVALNASWNGSDPVPIPVVPDTPVVIDPDLNTVPSPAAVDPVAVVPAPSEPDADVSPDLIDPDPEPAPTPVVSPAAATMGCEEWNTKEFFQTATVEQVTACLAAGADVHMRGEYGFTPLHFAAQFNENPAVIEALLAAGANLEARAEGDYTPLHFAAGFNENPAVIEALLAAGADVNMRGEDGGTPLHFAAGFNENPAVIEALLAAGANLEARAEGDYTPLHVAAQFNENPAVIETLLAAGADVNMRGEAGFTPLHVAAQFNENPAMIEALLAAGADVNARGEDGQTPLHKAAWFNENPAVIAALLAAGADVNARGEDGQTPLHKAAWFNENPAVIAALLAAGADVNARGEDGQTPLHEAAVFNENPAMIEALLAAGADVNAREELFGGTPLHKAAWFNENPAMIEALLAAGADVNARGEDGQTPLHEAARGNENPAVIEALLAAGADVNMRDELLGSTPLHFAAQFNENPAMIEALLAAGADVNARGEDGQTPLHKAAWFNENPAVIAALLAAGADVNMRSEDGQTPLHRAAGSSENPAVIETLLAAGADVNARNAGGETPWDLAQENEALKGSDAYFRLN